MTNYGGASGTEWYVGIVRNGGGATNKFAISTTNDINSSGGELKIDETGGKTTVKSLQLDDATPTTGVSAGLVALGKTTATTIGANGAASALTANPVGYLQINIGGTIFQLPYYNKA